MKKIRSIVISIAFVSFGYAQDTEKSFVPYYMVDGKVENFERVSAKMESKVIGFGYGGANQYLTVFNSKESPVRFKSDAIPQFIIKTDKDTDLFELVVLSKADVVKKSKTYRRFITRGFSMGGGAKDISKYLIVPELREIGDNLYEMVFGTEFEPGEYTFQPIYKGAEAENVTSTSGSVRIYCFGID